MKILVTGAAGFIGSYVVEYLLARGDQVIGIDSVNDYYDVGLKYGRLRRVGIDVKAVESDEYPGSGRFLTSELFTNYRFARLDICNSDAISRLFKSEKFDRVCHLAAQAGVRYSLESPETYIESNIVGFLGILEACRSSGIEHLVYASSSSVYGLNESMPFRTSQATNHPVSLYAASKKSNELMAHAYSHLFSIPTTGLRFFTVYGPWGRPDMALFLFAKAIMEGKPINVFNHGDMSRDFTYIDDIVEGVVRVLDSVPSRDPNWSGLTPSPASSSAPYRIYNLGNSKPVNLLQFIEELEKRLGKKAEKVWLPLQPGDVPSTWADVTDLDVEVGYRPSTSIEHGIAEFVRWYREYYHV